MHTIGETSLILVVGLINPKTMKIKGSVNGQELIVLMIDPRATNNFISIVIIERASISSSSHERFGVS